MEKKKEMKLLLFHYVDYNLLNNVLLQKITLLINIRIKIQYF